MAVDWGIRETTERNCIHYQNTAADLARRARGAVAIGDFDSAVTFQRAARRAADDASMRLERLIGVC